MNKLSVILSAIAAVMIGVILLAFAAFSIAYILDGLREVFVEGRVWLLILVFFGAPILTVLYWSALIMGVPIEAVRQGNFWALLLVPIGFGFGYLVWRASNWLVYDLLSFEPWAYNFLFGWMGLTR